MEDPKRTKSGLYLPESVTGEGLSKPPPGEVTAKEDDPILPEKYARNDCNTCHGQGTVKTIQDIVILCQCVEKRIRSNKGPRR